MRSSEPVTSTLDQQRSLEAFVNFSNPSDDFILERSVSLLEDEEDGERTPVAKPRPGGGGDNRHYCWSSGDINNKVRTVPSKCGTL